MIHYHGTPLGGQRAESVRFLRNRFAFVPMPRQEDLGIVAEVCSGFSFDNGAFSAWKSGEPITEWSAYYKWCREWAKHPGFQWAIIPDVIDGDEKDNAKLISQWERQMWHPVYVQGVPVWHLHESIDRLRRLTVQSHWHTVAIGSSGQWATPGTDSWHDRMREAMTAICDGDGKPPCKLHGLRMLDWRVFTYYPFASVDSTNVARNHGLDRAYRPPSASQRMENIAQLHEGHNSPAVFDVNVATQGTLF